MRKGSRAGLGLLSLLAVSVMGGGFASAKDLMGQPTPGAIDFQPAASVMKYDVINFHNMVLLPITVGICVLVAGLLLWCIIRYNAKANPVPARFSHNTTVEIIWTLVPVLILACIAFPSLGLLFKYHNMPKPDLTVKVTGYQWYWGYAYPDQNIPEIISAAQSEEDDKAKGDPWPLQANEAMVVPIGKVVRVQVTADGNAIHAFAMPAFGLKTDAIPGRLNETWFKADKIGTFYGQCSELCGKDHAFMPIAVRVVSEADYATWLDQAKKKYASDNGVRPTAV
ncbi:MAG: coxB, partial [Caulobacteraceae bacterium]|nr:coxB [Caulobacteraceae bacterium]